MYDIDEDEPENNEETRDNDEELQGDVCWKKLKMSSGKG